MSQNQSNNRRDLFRKVAAVIPSGIALFVSTKLVGAAPAAKPADAALKLVPDTDPTAKALKYVADATKAKREKRGVTEGKDQICSNCQMYTKQGDIGGKEVGKCLMIQGGSVAAAGWCNSWIKKA